MAKLELGEPLLSDGDLSHVVHRLSEEYPQLRELDTDYVTWVQEPQEMIGPDGLVTKLPEVGVFALVSRGKLTKGAVYLRTFEQELDQNKAATMIFRAVAREHIRVMKALEGIQDGESRSIRGTDV